MEADVKIDVSTLDAPHRRALEEVIGRELAANQQLIISVTEVAAVSRLPTAVQNEVPPSGGERPAQTLDDWTHVYDGLTDEEIEAIDQVVKTRANLTRNLP